MAQNNQRDPNLRAATVARVNQLLKNGLTKAGAFDKISAETGRAKDAVQMLYYRAMRAAAAAKLAGAKAAPAKPVATKPVATKPVAAKAAPVKVAATKPAVSRPATRPFVAKPVSAKPAVAVAVPKPAASAVVAAPVAAPARKRSSSRANRRRRALARAKARANASGAPRPQGVAQSGDFPALLNGIATAINALLKHVEKTVEENKTLKEQGERLKAITNLIRGR